jgi:hypothetical protein
LLVIKVSQGGALQQFRRQLRLWPNSTAGIVPKPARIATSLASLVDSASA